MEKYCAFCDVLIEGYTRSTKKYCSDNCKQLAFYARQGMNWGKPADQVSVKPDFTLSGNTEPVQDTEPPVVMQEAQKLPPPAEIAPVTIKPESADVKEEPKAKYQWISSPLFDEIEKIREHSWAEIMFQVPGRYWTVDAIPYVEWVTVRLRCLLENILRLSSFSVIDRETLRQLSGAFNDLTASRYFRYIPRNYPFSGLIVNLRDKLANVAKGFRGEEITLRLSCKRKAELMAARFMIGNFVPKTRFSFLDFNDTN